MPIKCNWGTWNNFIKECGGIPHKPYLSELAIKNKILAKKGKRSSHWKGGKHQDKWGYIHIWMPDHPNAKGSGYIHEHRFIMSEYLGRPLIKFESVHHKNGIKNDNRIENLELMQNRVHHGNVKCPHCGKVFRIR